ncbi:MAG: 50S ribosomal protein L13 [Nanoarchaeota archaeon]|nr:50S ribosomal protein L13 [Nanoarchaeota archaeon]MBU1104249.1 50S ribosomal protein L13 [Nanoarchaeota archaeon]
MTTKIIIDAAEGALGRIAGFAAKQSLLGKEVVIVNCNDAMITGSPRTTIAKYAQKRARGGSAQKGPYFPKSPERIMKRTVRGMLSYKQTRGRQALKRIICYNQTPSEFEDAEKISMKREIKVKAIKLKKLSEEL